MLKKKRYFMLIIPVALAAVIWGYSFWSSPWKSATFTLSNNAHEYTVFEENLESGKDIIVRLDMKPGAEGKGRLILLMPDSRQVEWIDGYQQTRRQLNIKSDQNGEYKLLLITASHGEQDGKTYPEIEVDWFFR